MGIFSFFIMFFAEHFCSLRSHPRSGRSPPLTLRFAPKKNYRASPMIVFRLRAVFAQPDLD
jgi:hypothetical protein